MDAILGLFTNPLVLTAVGIAVKYFPPLAKVPNALIPVLNTLLAFFAAWAAPAAAHAAMGPLGFDTAHLAVGFNFFGVAGGLLGGVAAAAWQAAQSHLIWEMFGRPAADTIAPPKAAA